MSIFHKKNSFPKLKLEIALTANSGGQTLTVAFGYFIFALVACYLMERHDRLPRTRHKVSAPLIRSFNLRSGLVIYGCLGVKLVVIEM